jgi:hypothetical protein
MRIPVKAHTEQPWRIHEIAPDFRIEDVWAFRTPGAGPDDFATMLDALFASNAPQHADLPTRLLFAVRWKLGALLGWDEPEQEVGGRVHSLRERLPADLREAPVGRNDPDIPFTPVYQLHNECAQELANKTVHDILHLGWVQTDQGEYELRMAALVKPNGLLGRIYMVAIKPFRYLIIYPALTRRWERAWRNRDRQAGSGAHTTPPTRPKGTSSPRSAPSSRAGTSAATPSSGPRPPTRSPRATRKQDSDAGR